MASKSKLLKLKQELIDNYGEEFVLLKFIFFKVERTPNGGIANARKIIGEKPGIFLRDYPLECRSDYERVLDVIKRGGMIKYVNIDNLPKTSKEKEENEK